MNCPHCQTDIDEHEAGLKTDVCVAEAVMGWEFLRIGYTGEHKGADAETPRQVELEKAGWLDEVGLTSVGSYYIDEPNHKWITLKGDWMHENVWSPSTDIAAAWKVLEQLVPTSVDKYDPEGRRYSIAMLGGRATLVLVNLPGHNEGEVRGEAETVPLVICRAALKAVVREEQREPA